MSVYLVPAIPGDSEFAYRVKKAAFKPYVDQIGDWDEAEQRHLHEERFRSQKFRVIIAKGEPSLKGFMKKQWLFGMGNFKKRLRANGIFARQGVKARNVQSKSL